MAKQKLYVITDHITDHNKQKKKRYFNPYQDISVQFKEEGKGEVIKAITGRDEVDQESIELVEIELDKLLEIMSKHQETFKEAFKTETEAEAEAEAESFRAPVDESYTNKLLASRILYLINSQSKLLESDKNYGGFVWKGVDCTKLEEKNIFRQVLSIEDSNVIIKLMINPEEAQEIYYNLPEWIDEVKEVKEVKKTPEKFSWMKTLTAGAVGGAVLCTLSVMALDAYAQGSFIHDPSKEISSALVGAILGMIIYGICDYNDYCYNHNRKIKHEERISVTC